MYNYIKYAYFELTILWFCLLGVFVITVYFVGF